MAPLELAKSRPAESGGLAGAVAVLLCAVLGVTDPTTIAAVGVVAAAAPAVITAAVVALRRRGKLPPAP